MKSIQVLTFFFLLTNYSFGQFESKYIHLSSIVANRSKMFDIDSDGDLDFIVNRGSKIIYKLNNGIGEFGELKVKSMNSVIENFVVFDFDQDGYNDIIFIDGEDYNFKWFRNLGNENYSSSIPLFFNIQTLTDIYGIDLDNDGDSDLVKVYNSSAGTFTVRENMGNSTFGPDNVVNSGTTNINKLKFYDINQDGLKDAVYVTNDAFGNWKYACSINLGSCMFGPEIIISTATSGSTIFFAFDYDNDNDLDICYIDGENDKIVWHENINSTVFNTEQFIQIPNGQNLFFGVDMDVDTDGLVDIVASVSDNLVYYKNLGGGAFSTSNIITSNVEGAHNTIVADINNDGQSDLFYENMGFYWLKKTGSDTFSSSIGISVGIQSPKGGIFIDYDGDSKKDLFIIGNNYNSVVWNKNKGNNDFETGKILEPVMTSSNCYIKKVDLNSDGLDDIVTNLYQFNGLGWRKNLGNGQFSNYNGIIGWGVFMSQNDFEFGDIDNDGDMDIVFTSENCAFRWVKNLGNNQFENSSSLVPGAIFSYADIELADLNLDGNLDVIYTKGNGVAWQENLGNGIFGGEQIITTLTNQTRSIKTADIDQDGLVDIVSISYTDNKLAWYKNLGGGQFAVQQVISSQLTSPKILVLGDLNCDGKVDIITANNSEVSWFENLGTGQFGEKTIIINEISEIASISIDEIDDDGDLDILITSSGSETILLINQYVHEYQVSGKLFYDEDQNGVFDNNDVGIPNASVLTSPSSSYSYTYQNGNFITNFSDTVGTYIISPEIIEHWNISSTPLSYSINVTSNFTNQTGLDFGFYPDSLYNEITPMIFSSSTRCNDTVNYWIDLKNTGTLQNSGILELKLDPSVQYFNSNVPFDSINSNSIYWHFDNLNAFEQIQFNISVVMPDFQSLGSIIIDSVNIFVLNNNIVTNEFNVAQTNVLTCAYDPNDKTVNPKGLTNLGNIPSNTQWLNYVIRFQNTGNDTAQHVRIEDNLDANLEQLIVLSSSHPLQTMVDESNKISFIFNNINLPDSNVNVLASQGYVAYKARLKSNLPNGTQISNVAEIYFDYNPAIVTNSVVNTIHEENSSNLNELVKNETLLVYPNPFTDFVIIELLDKNFTENYYLEVNNTLGQVLIDKVQFEQGKIQLSRSELGIGILLFKLYSDSGELIQIERVISY